ncbi:MAG: hypothetical protein K9J85_11425 [Desulfobacteraceae bacterium]|nr:hypothetical protein [Desulfobacteraceae bacterium]
MGRLTNNPAKPLHSVSEAFLAACLLCLILLPTGAAAGKDFSVDWGGHLRIRSSAADPEADSRLDILRKNRLYDTGFEFRSRHELNLSNAWELDLHYEMTGTAGDTRKAETEFLKRYPAAGRFYAVQDDPDQRRLMDLSHVITSDSDDLLYHRLDRLVLTARRDWATLRVGRQALTWGNGFLFNPMDLFNPFSPTDVERDYKAGDDMVTFQTYTGASGDIQALYVPRRNPETGDLEWNQSSAAAKYHRYLGSLEMDLMAGIHYEDFVAGFGLIGYLGGAAWRLDATYTWLDDSARRSGFVSLCANLDYSWTWWGKNMYGWIEYYYTGLGTDDYQEAVTAPDIMERLVRGERYTLGRSYLDANLRAELHPLLNFHITMITNPEDPSGALQPRLVWDARQNLQLTAGANLYWGGPDTEFGGFDTPNLPFKEAPADSVYVWASFFY